MSESLNGSSLDRYLKSPLKIDVFFSFAISIVRALSDFHRKGFVHKDIKPKNIFFNSELTKVRFGGLTLVSSVQTTASDLTEGTFAYMSPEQTGRMNWPVDRRSDLYSIGTIFFEMLAGELPFSANTPLEWVYNHIARAPDVTKLSKLEVPEILVQIIVKLMAKIADDRYQTADGLLYDLEYCQAEWNKNGHIDLFVLGQKDFPDQLLIPQKLYGREKEISFLFEAFKRVLKNKKQELVLISGYSGVGKSALVNELQRPIFREHGLYITGKFDQYKKNAPFLTFVQAFDKLILNLLIQSESEVANWSKKLKNALGENAQLIIEVIPQLELLVGPQPPVAELPPLESLNRFRSVFLNFIRVFTQDEHPLTLFLDDLQWVDMASLGLLKILATASDIGSLLVIGSYRDNEVDENHMLSLALRDLKKTDAIVSNIFLAPLTFEKLNLLVADALKISEAKVQPLSKLVFEKTDGNPFFVIQLLKVLFDEGSLSYSRKKIAWQWDLEKIRSKEYADNILQLVIQKIKSLPISVQDLLKGMACLGNTVPKNDLKIIFDYSEEFITTSLAIAQDNGILTMDGDICKFVHDQIHEAAYSLISPGQHAEAHLHISQVMLNRFSKEKIDSRIFDVVEQINQSSQLFVEANQKNQGAELNLIAAEKAKASTAFKAAAHYCTQGLKILPSDFLNLRFDLFFSLSLLQVQCELAAGNVETAERLLPAVLKNARSKIDQASARQVQINIHVAKGQSEKALNAALELLKMYGLEVSSNPPVDEVEKIDKILWARMTHVGIKTLQQLSIRSDEHKDLEIVIEVLSNILPSAYFINVHMHRLVACYMVDLTLRYGVFQMSPVGLMAYGLELNIQKRYKDAAELGACARHLVEKYQLQICRSKVFQLLGAILYPWISSFASAIAALDEAIVAENGDVIFKSLAQLYKILLLFEIGTELNELNAATDRALLYIESREIQIFGEPLIALQKFISELKGTNGPADYSQRILSHSDPIVLAWGSFYRLQSNIFFNEFEKAEKESEVFGTLVIHLRGQPIELEYAFFTGLAITGSWDTANPEQQNSCLPKLKKIEQDLRDWSDLNPENFKDRWLLIAAEVARVEKNYFQAQLLYTKAIQASIDGKFVHMTALCYERAAQFYKSQKLDLIYETYIKKSYISYLQWGATAKAAQLAKANVDLDPKLVSPMTSLLSDTVSAKSEQLDFLSIIKASQIISGKIDFEELVPTLLKVIMEQSGARKAVLALWKDDALSLEAIVKVGNSGYETEMLQSDRIDSSPEIPKSILRYVQRVKEAVIFNDASTEAAQFSADEYITRAKPKALLSLPILRGQELVGVLYLENDVTHGVFSESRLSALQLIAAQVAVSLQNALYYKALRSSQKQLQSIVDSTTAVIAVRDLQGRFVLVNKQFELILGLSEENIIGKTDYDIFPKDLADRIRSQDLKVLETGASVEQEILSPYGESNQTYLSTKFPLFTEDNKLYAICTIATDISVRIRIEKEREALLEATQKSVKVRDDFIAIVSHELRTPLTPLKLSLDMLGMNLQQVSAADLPKLGGLIKAFEKTEKIVGRLSKLTEAILDVSTIASDRLILKYAEVDLVKLIREVVNSFSEALSKSRCNLEIKIENEPIVGFWDRARIQQVIENLLRNAIKYGPGMPIEIVLIKTEAWVKFEISDHGVGIAPAEQARIFERFERAVSINNYGGLGLGLYIARAIVAAHGGSITVRSGLNKGSTFSIQLPVSSR